MGTSSAVPPQWRESGLGLWKVVWVVGRRESKTGEESRQRVSWSPRSSAARTIVSTTACTWELARGCRERRADAAVVCGRPVVLAALGKNLARGGPEPYRAARMRNSVLVQRLCPTGQSCSPAGRERRPPFGTDVGCRSIADLFLAHQPPTANGDKPRGPSWPAFDEGGRTPMETRRSSLLRWPHPRSHAQRRR